MGRKRKYSQSEIHDWVNKQDINIRNGHFKRAKSLFQGIEVTKVPADKLYSIADIARRLNQPYLAIKLLHSQIYQDKKIVPAASPKDIALYSTLLALTGNVSEAQLLLENTDLSNNKSLFFSWLYVLLPEWRYKEAISPIKKYLTCSHLSKYQVLVGQINLAACYVFLGYTIDADKVLLRAKSAAKKLDANLLHLNVIELQLQLAYARSHKSECEALILEYKKLRVAKNSIYNLYFEKWQWLANAKFFSSTHRIENFRDIQKKALKVGSPETLRDLDFHLSTITKDKELFNFVYYCSPFKSYRSYINKVFDKEYAVPAKSVFNMFSKSSEIVRHHIEFENRDGFVPSGSILHRCFIILLSDCYQSTPMGKLFSRLYPGEYFDPYSSSQRVCRVVERLRNELQRAKLPIEISLRCRHFKVTFTDDVSMSLSREVKEISRSYVSLSQLQRRFKNRTFSSLQASNLLGLSQRATQKLLKEAALPG